MTNTLPIIQKMKKQRLNKGRKYDLHSVHSLIYLGLSIHSHPFVSLSSSKSTPVMTAYTVAYIDKLEKRIPFPKWLLGYQLTSWPLYVCLWVGLIDWSHYAGGETPYLANPGVTLAAAWQIAALHPQNPVADELLCTGPPLPNYAKWILWYTF